MITLTVLTAFFAIGFMVHSAYKQSQQAAGKAEMTPEPVTQMGR